MSQKTERKLARSLGWGALALVLVAGQTACGGGGGGGNAPFVGAPASMSMPATAPAPVSEPGPSPTDAEPDPAREGAPTPTQRTLAPGAELAPRLAAPQPGSTAETGNGTQGIYEDTFGYTFISSTGRLSAKDLLNWYFGAIDIDGLNWAFRVPTILVDSTGDVEFLTGSGTFASNRSMSGDFYEGSSTSAKKWGRLSYSTFNALAVIQQDMAGKWSVDNSSGIGISLDIDVIGNVAGSTAGSKVGECSLTGTLMQTEPSTSRNMFDLVLKASNAATNDVNACKLDQVESYNGLGAVVLTNVSFFKEEGAYRALTFHVATANLAILTAYLRKR